MVSILIAARNEESNIRSCLESVQRLSYPAEKLEVLIGNDQSEDLTAERVRTFIQDKPHFKLINIDIPPGKLPGKAQVLAQLIRHSKGDYLLFTDADVILPPHWVEHMLAACSPGIGLVSGISLPYGSQLFEQLQSFEWLHAQAQIGLAADLGIPVTAMGNNMLVSREAYLATGGYEHLPFSVVEDQALFQAIVQQGYGFKNLRSVGVLVTTQPVNSFTDLLQQRKRWMKGALQIHWLLICLLFIQALFIPLLIILSCFFPKLAVAIFAAKVATEGWFLYPILRKLGQKDLMKHWLIYQFYQASVQFALIIYYFLPISIEWKGRKYA